MKVPDSVINIAVQVVDIFEKAGYLPANPTNG